ncbi:MAG: Lrp/AsnC family transcriptional regulator [Methylococcaceae bacterium]
MLSDLHKHLLDDFQRDFPLTPRPYLTIANRLGVSETDVLNAFEQLNQQQFISRIGAVIPPNHIGSSSLVAMAIPPEQLHEVAEKISVYPEINHNYEREHRFNLWFVAVANSAEQLESLIIQIEQDTGYQALRLPLVQDFFIDLGFKLNWQHAR